jgi:hypothetical protein
MNTENWRELTTDGSEQETYREYDEIIAMTLEEIYQRSAKEGIIRLYRFNRKSLNHMCILRIALIARDIFQFPIEVDASWWDVFCLNWKLHKNFDKVKRYKLKMNVNDSNGINAPMLIDKYQAICDTTCRKFCFADIYEAYYERKI